MSDFKVYTNPDIKKKRERRPPEEVELAMLPTENLVDQYFASAFFYMTMKNHGGWYVAEELPPEEGPLPDMYPLLERNLQELFEGNSLNIFKYHICSVVLGKDILCSDDVVKVGHS